MQPPLLLRDQLNADELQHLDGEGYLCLPGLLTRAACLALTASLQRVSRLADNHSPPAGSGRLIYEHYAAEHDEFLASLIGHPQMLRCLRSALGPNVRYDHCVALNRKPGYSGLPWHGHSYSDDDPSFKFLRIFFYVSGFSHDDAALKVVPGSHHFRDALGTRKTDRELESEWLPGKVHLKTRKPLYVEKLQVPERSVVLMWTHTIHGVSSGNDDCGMRWAVVYGYRNPGKPSTARWISEDFERRAPPAAQGLMTLY